MLSPSKGKTTCCRSQSWFVAIACLLSLCVLCWLFSLYLMPVLEWMLGFGPGPLLFPSTSTLQVMVAPPIAELPFQAHLNVLWQHLVSFPLQSLRKTIPMPRVKCRHGLPHTPLLRRSLTPHHLSLNSLYQSTPGTTYRQKWFTHHSSAQLTPIPSSSSINKCCTDVRE